MAASTAERAAMADLSTYDFDWRPPGGGSIARPDVFAWVWPAPNASARGVARATFADRDIEPRAREIGEFFGRRGLTARWHVGPTNPSKALVDFLGARAGAVQEPRDMTAELSALRYRANPDVVVAEVATSDMHRAFVERCFPDLSAAYVDDDVERWSGRYCSATRRGAEIVGYLDGELVGH